MIKAFKHCVILRIYIDNDLNTVPKYNACFFLAHNQLAICNFEEKKTINSEVSLKCLN